MKAPLSCSVPLACDLLALSKSCNAINDKARGKKKEKKSKGHKQGGFDRPLFLGHWLYGRISHDIVWLCVSLHKSRWLVLSELSGVKYLWLRISVRVHRACPIMAFESVVGGITNTLAKFSGMRDHQWNSNSTCKEGKALKITCAILFSSVKFDSFQTNRLPHKSRLLIKFFKKTKAANFSVNLLILFFLKEKWYRVNYCLNLIYA